MRTSIFIYKLVCSIYISPWRLTIYLFTDQSRIDPTKMSIVVKEDITIQCQSVSPVVWTFNGAELPTNANILGDIGDILYIDDVSSFNEGQYECKGFTDGYSQFMARTEVSVIGNFVYVIYYKVSICRYVCMNKYSLPSF